ncbi:MAG: FKBP-type peptidyl-prolyl cis-trans isomerase [Faecalibacterium prausnitzii]
MIDGFEDQIIGHNIGDTFDVTVTFPEGYGDSTDAEGNTITLSGKEAVFSVTLNAITQSVVPTLTDEWVESNLPPATTCTPQTPCASTLTAPCTPTIWTTPRWTICSRTPPLKKSPPRSPATTSVCS